MSRSSFAVGKQIVLAKFPNMVGAFSLTKAISLLNVDPCPYKGCHLVNSTLKYCSLPLFLARSVSPKFVRLYQQSNLSNSETNKLLYPEVTPIRNFFYDTRKNFNVHEPH